MAKTVRMTTAQAIVKFLDNQYVSMDGVETKFVEGFFTIFGHGIAVGLGEALDTNPGQLKVLQGRNEQGMCHVATAFAKQSNRKKIIACASSIGPGAANMVTACATATVNNIPLLVFQQILLHPASLTRFFSSWSRAAVLPSVQTMHSNQSANTGIGSQDRRWL